MQQMFLGLGAAPPIEITASNATNIDLATVFGSDWTENKNKVYIVPSGVTLGATGTSNYGITVSTGMGGNLEINVSGTVIGYGGSAGSGGYSPGGSTKYTWSGYQNNGNPGGAGGHAIDVKSANVTVNNLSGGQISGGGGGGGGGGTGQVADVASWFWVGGHGGNGGIGAGYNGSAGSGSSGGTATYGGNGGTGGNGGSYGTAGSNGSSGQSASYGGQSRGSGGSGGAAGKAIHSSNGQSWTNGTTAGTYHGSYT